MKVYVKPSIGFYLLIIMYLATIAFFVWGSTEPRLERVWVLENSLSSGDILNLSSSEKKLFIDVMKDYPDYVEELVGLNGVGVMSAQIDNRPLFSTIVLVRDENIAKCKGVYLDVSGHSSSFPVSWTVTGGNWSKKIEAKKSSSVFVEFPKGKSMPEIVDIVLDDKNNNVDVKLRLCQ